ncbi:MAG: hypothetical protein DELT_02345 [Desulfovibrio sp.]
MKRLILLSLFFLLALSGCVRPSGKPSLVSGMAPAPERTARQEAGSPVIEQGKRLHIFLPQDATREDRSFAGSGSEVARLFAKHCKNDAKSITLGKKPLPADTDIEETLAAIRKTGADYAIIPEITHWEPREAKRPACALSVAVYDVRTGELLADKAVSTDDPALAPINGAGNASLEDAVYRFCAWAFSGE